MESKEGIVINAFPLVVVKPGTITLLYYDASIGVESIRKIKNLGYSVHYQTSDYREENVEQGIYVMPKGNIKNCLKEFQGIK